MAGLESDCKELMKLRRDEFDVNRRRNEALKISDRQERRKALERIQHDVNQTRKAAEGIVGGILERG